VQDLIAASRDANWTLQSIAVRLNRLSIRTPQGFKWYPSSIRAALKKIEKARNNGNTIGRNNEFVPSSNLLLPDVLLPANPSSTPSTGREAMEEGNVSMSGITEAEWMIDIFTRAAGILSGLTQTPKSSSVAHKPTARS
jgi:hypothetical protein